MAFPSSLGSPFSDYTLDPPYNYSPKDDTQDKAVLTALYTIQTNRDVKIRRDSKNFLIQQFFEQGFELYTPNTPRRITSKMYQQAIWRTMARMKPMDFEVFVTGKPEYYRKIVTAALSTVMDRGNYTNSLTAKEGVFQKMLLYGDAFLHFGANPDPEANFPIYYQPISNSNLYFDTYATGMRSGGIGREVRKVAAIFSMGWATACHYYPKIQKLAAPGRIPRDVGFLKELERSYLQTNKEYDMIEICYYYDLDNEIALTFAGPTCAILNKFQGKKYPFRRIQGNQPYIPILQFSCMPSTEGFYNHGIGDMLFDIAMFSQQLKNMGYNHIADNADPFTLISVPEGQTAKLLNSMRAAGEMRASGKRPVIPMEFDPANPNGNRIGMQALTTQNMENELISMIQVLEKEIIRLGINLDDTQYGEGVTKYQIVAEQENQDKFVQQMQSLNEPTYQFAVETALDSIVQLCSSSDKTLLNFTFPLTNDKGEIIKTDQITLGAVRDALKKENVFVEMDDKSGYQPSNTLEQARIEKVLAVTPPNTPAQFKALATYAELNGAEISEKDFQMGQPQSAPMGQGQLPTQGAQQPAQPNPQLQPA